MIEPWVAQTIAFLIIIFHLIILKKSCMLGANACHCGMVRNPTAQWREARKVSALVRRPPRVTKSLLLQMLENVYIK